MWSINMVTFFPQLILEFSHALISSKSNTYPKRLPLTSEFGYKS